MLDLLLCERFVTLTDLGTNASVTLQKYDGNLVWAEKIFFALGKELKSDQKNIDATKINTNLENIFPIFSRFVYEKKGDYALWVKEDGSYVSAGSDWDRLMRNVDRKRSVELSLPLKPLTDAETRVIAKGDLRDHFFQSKEAPEKVKLALFNGLISQFHAAKLFMSFAIKGKRGSLCDKTIESHERNLLTFFHSYPQEKKEALLERFNTLPVEDSQYFIVNGGEYIERGEAYTTIDQLIGAKRGPFISVDIEDNLSFFLAPPKLQYEIQRILHGSNAILANPVTGGLSAPHDFESPVFRDVYIPVPGIVEPTSVHDLTADGIGTTIHDAIGHLIVEDSNPRIPLIRVARKVREHFAYWNEILDRNTPYINSLNPNQLFWLKLALISVNLQGLAKGEKAFACNRYIRAVLDEQELYARYGIFPLSESDIAEIKRAVGHRGHENEHMQLFLSQYKLIESEDERLLVQELELLERMKIAKDIETLIDRKTQELEKVLFRPITPGMSPDEQYRIGSVIKNDIQNKKEELLRIKKQQQSIFKAIEVRT